MSKIKRALISVWDKNGIVELAKFLFQNNIENIGLVCPNCFEFHSI